MTDQRQEPALVQSGDVEDLVRIWNEAFGDDPEYIRNFLRLAAEPDNVVVSHEDGKAVSAAYLLENSLVVRGRSYSAYYFYAAATDPEYRGKGHMSRIIEYCIALAKERDVDFIYLVPAEGSLYHYYSKYGFRTCFYARTVNFSRKELAAAICGEESAEPEAENPYTFALTDVPKVREEALAGTDHVALDYKVMQYALFEHACCGGEILCDGNSYALYNNNNGTVVITELCPPTLDGSMARLLLQLDARKYVFHAPYVCEVEGHRKTLGRAGMAIALNKKARTASGQMQNAYIGITLG